MKKTLGRCERKHANVVEYEAEMLPSGVCKVCGGELIEWAVRHPVKQGA